MMTLLVSNAVQAALLGAKDSLTPLKALSASALLNAIGDIALVCWLGYGVTGAAIATVASQMAGLALLMQHCLDPAVPDTTIASTAELIRQGKPRPNHFDRVGYHHLWQ